MAAWIGAIGSVVVGGVAVFATVALWVWLFPRCATSSARTRRRRIDRLPLAWHSRPMPDAKTATNEPQGEWTAVEAALIAKARSLAPVMRERAGQAEQLRRIPDETDADFRAAGFYRIMQPARYGGLESRYGLHTMLARGSRARLRLERLGAVDHRLPLLDLRHVSAGGAGRVLGRRPGARGREFVPAGRTAGNAGTQAASA